MQRYLKYAWRLAAVLAASPTLLPAQGDGVTPAQLARVDSLFRRWDNTQSPGCAVGVSRDGRILLERGYGMSDLQYGLAITPASIFHVASISKQFTAFAVMLLAQDGKLSLDDDIRRHVPEVPDYGRRITIRHLMQHTSGLRDQWVLLRLAGWRADDLITEDDVLWAVSRQRAANFAPGEEYLYSNTGFTLLAVIVKRVSGKSLREFAEERIFRPLGMGSTHFHDDHTMIVPNRTSAYQPKPNGGWRISIPVFDTYGATSLFTTARDLLLWERNFADGKVGGLPLLQEMQQEAKLNGGDGTGYGLGLAVGSYRGLRTVGHGGADAGYRADVVRFPDQAGGGGGLAVAVLCNLAPINPSQLTRQVAEVFLGDRMAPPPARPAPVEVAQSELARWAGVYRNPVTEEVRRFSVREGKLMIGQGTGIALTPVAPDRFVLPDAGPEYRFAAPSPSVVQVTLTAEGQRPATFRREAPFKPDAAALSGYAGRYRSEELDVVYDVSPADSGLVVKHPKLGTVRLQPLFPDAFQGSGETIGFLAQFTRDAKGRVDGFLASAGRVRRLRFVRQ